MSDYISIKDDRLWDILFDEACVEGKQAERIQKELEKIAVDEKEIIRKPFERVVERLESDLKWTRAEQSIECERTNGYGSPLQSKNSGKIEALKKAIEILKEECGINE